LVTPQQNISDYKTGGAIPHKTTIMKMKRELFLQIAEIENANDASQVISRISNAWFYNEITSEDFDHLMADLTITLKSLGIFK